MPIKTCTSGGKSGWKFGDEGKCFTGPNAKQRATKQGQAIKISQQKGSLLDKVKDNLDKK